MAYFVVTRKVHGKWWTSGLFEAALWISVYVTVGSGGGFERPELYGLGFLFMALLSALVSVCHGWKTAFAVLIVVVQLVFTQVGISVATRNDDGAGSCPWPSRYDEFYKHCEFH
ncbi:hypothetical protein BKP30_29150 [Rhodococcus erythropolis]|nr:hypothetical protein BKP30_29150 [Rhodococcus erythropolis]